MGRKSCSQVEGIPTAFPTSRRCWRRGSTSDFMADTGIASRRPKRVTRGVADLDTLRAAIQGAKVALCLVRRANRDGHVMRTFEVPAVGACMVTEDTSEHREIFGDDGRNVVYFKTIPEMVERCRWLLTRPDEILRLRTAAHRLIVDGGNTYRDRLRQIVRLLSR